jgi:exodeoxyribonuclease-5
MQDRNQLPPVKEAGLGYFVTDSPNFTLTKVHRQAAKSPVLRLATQIVSTKNSRLQPGEYDGVGGVTRVVRASELSKTQLGELVMGCSQIICGKNETRVAYNKAVRKRLGLYTDDAMPVPGDKLVCLANNYETGVLNGQLFSVTDVMDRDQPILILTLVNEDDGNTLITRAHACLFKGEAPPPWLAREADQFTYGYALTCHKAQGSQWPSVCIIDESFCFRQDAWRWMYTALTRAAKQAVVIV